MEGVLLFLHKATQVHMSPFLVIATQIWVTVYALQCARMFAYEGLAAGMRASIMWVALAALALIGLTILGGGWPITSKSVARAWEAFFICGNLLNGLALWLSIRDYPDSHPLSCSTCKAVRDMPAPGCGGCHGAT